MNDVGNQIFPKHLDFLNVRPPFWEETKASEVPIRQTELQEKLWEPFDCFIRLEKCIIVMLSFSSKCLTLIEHVNEYVFYISKIRVFCVTCWGERRMERGLFVFILGWGEQPSTLSDVLQQSGLRSCSEEPAGKWTMLMFPRTNCFLIFFKVHIHLWQTVHEICDVYIEWIMNRNIMVNYKNKVKEDWLDSHMKNYYDRNPQII